MKSRRPRKTMTSKNKNQNRNWAALTCCRAVTTGSNYASSKEQRRFMLLFYILLYTLIHRVPRRGREPQGVQTTRAWRWHCDNFGPRRWRTHRSSGSNEKAAFAGLFRYYNNIITLYCDDGHHVQHPIPLHDSRVRY